MFFLILFLFSLPLLVFNYYIEKTEMKPAVGGSFTEGLVGSPPRFINPLYAAASSDIDRDITELVFSGLMKYNLSGEIVYDLAEMVAVKEDGRLYEVYIKKDVLWHDGGALTADDVIFTLELIQNPDYKSPLRGNYIGIDAEKIHEHLIELKIKDPYAGFKERLTFKILPKHIWQDVSPENIILKEQNWQPVGSGPYQFKELNQNFTLLKLERFNKYFGTKPHLAEINFRFFDSEEELTKEVKAGNIDGFSLPKDKTPTRGFTKHSFSMPRYFAVFLNIKESGFLAKKTIRQALNYGTDKGLLAEKFLSDGGEILEYYPFDPKKAEELLETAGLQKKDGKWFEIAKGKTVEFRSDLKEGNRGAEVTALQACLGVSPTGYFGGQTKAAVIAFQEKYAEEILAPSGLRSGTGTVGQSTKTKLNEICSEPPTQTEVSFTMVTVEDPVLKKTAEEISRQWEELGIKLNTKTHPFSQLQREFIKPREYEMLLIGQSLTLVEDPFPFWHSSQIKDPGLNLAKYENTKADRILEDARTILDQKEREEKLQEFQEILIEDAPAVFLYNPDYVYWVSERIEGVSGGLVVDPSKRFANIEEWYTRTKRSWR